MINIKFIKHTKHKMSHVLFFVFLWVFFFRIDNNFSTAYIHLIGIFCPLYWSLMRINIISKVQCFLRCPSKNVLVLSGILNFVPFKLFFKRLPHFFVSFLYPFSCSKFFPGISNSFVVKHALLEALFHIGINMNN